jgi:site-specific DNA recombinase
MKVLGYIRVSSNKQVSEGSSLFNQKTMIEDYCIRNNYELLDILNDEGVSGLKRNRNGLNDLLDKIKKYKVDMVVVYSLSRLGRKMKDVIDIIDYMNTNNVRFISLKENFDNNGIMGKLLLNIMSSVNEFEVNIMGERISDVKKYKKVNREPFGGRLLYGVDEVDGKLVENWKELEVICLMNELRDIGFSFSRIADYLNDHNIKAKLNGKWYSSSVRMVLVNGVLNEMFYFNGGYVTNN